MRAGRAKRVAVLATSLCIVLSALATGSSAEDAAVDPSLVAVLPDGVGGMLVDRPRDRLLLTAGGETDQLRAYGFDGTLLDQVPLLADPLQMTVSSNESVGLVLLADETVVVVDLATFDELSRFSVDVGDAGTVTSIGYADGRLWLAVPRPGTSQGSLYSLNPAATRPRPVFEMTVRHIQSLSSVPAVPDRLLVRYHTIFPPAVALYRVQDQVAALQYEFDGFEQANPRFIGDGSGIVAGRFVLNLDGSVQRSYDVYPARSVYRAHGGGASDASASVALYTDERLLALYTGDVQNPVRLLGTDPGETLTRPTFSPDGDFLFAVAVSGDAAAAPTLHRYAVPDEPGPTISFTPSAERPLAGTDVHVKGRLTGDSGAPLENAPVLIWARRLNWSEGSFMDVETVRTDAVGEFTWERFGEAPGYELLVRFAGDDTRTQTTARYQLDVRADPYLSLDPLPDQVEHQAPVKIRARSQARGTRWAKPAGRPWRSLGLIEDTPIIVNPRRTTTYEARSPLTVEYWPETQREVVRVRAGVTADLANYDRSRVVDGATVRVYRDGGAVVVRGAVAPNKAGSVYTLVVFHRTRDGRLVTDFRDTAILNDESRVVFRVPRSSFRSGIRYDVVGRWDGDGENLHSAGFGGTFEVRASSD